MTRRVSAAVALACLAGGCKRPVEQLFAQPIESASYSNPVVTRDMIIFGSDEGGVYGYYKDGTRRWTFNPNLRQVFSAPAWDGENLIFFGATNQRVYAVAVDTGQQAWAFRTQDRVKGDPAFWQGLVIIGSYDKHLYGLDARTGKPRWVFPQPRPRPPAQKGKPPVEEPERHVVDTGEFSYSAGEAPEGRARAPAGIRRRLGEAFACTPLVELAAARPAAGRSLDIHLHAIWRRAAAALRWKETGPA